MHGGTQDSQRTYTTVQSWWRSLVGSGQFAQGLKLLTCSYMSPGCTQSEGQQAQSHSAALCSICAENATMSHTVAHFCRQQRLTNTADMATMRLAEPLQG